MSALAKVVYSTEEEMSFEAACKDELHKALQLIEELQKELFNLRSQLAETELLATQKELLLCSASVQERALRAELLKNKYLINY